MKRFYDHAEAAPAEGGFAVALDGRVAKTPMQRPLVLPGAALAEAVAAEWQAQAGEIRPHHMPLTRLATTTIDLLPEHRADMVREAAVYAETDLVCHRADAPAELAAQQEEGWQPLVDWLAERHGARLETARGVLPVAQPAEALAALRAVIESYDGPALVALHALVTASGSLVIALALAGGRIDAEAAWELSRIDERYQIEKWGEDTEAAEARARVAADFHAAARFLALSRICG